MIWCHCFRCRQFILSSSSGVRKDTGTDLSVRSSTRPFVRPFVRTLSLQNRFVILIGGAISTHFEANCLLGWLTSSRNNRQWLLTEFGKSMCSWPPWAWLTFGALINPCSFLVSDWLSSVCTFSCKMFIESLSHLVETFVMGLPSPD